MAKKTREEAHFTIKGIDKLPAKGNMNYLYYLKDFRLDVLYKFLPNGAYEGIPLGSPASTGLEALDEGNGIGWRLIGRDPLNYGNVGLNATDFSFSTTPTNTLGATGDRAFTIGSNTLASGVNAFSGGSDNSALNKDEFAIGRKGTVAIVPAEIPSSLERLFNVGNGSFSASDAFSVYYGGEILAPSLTIAKLTAADDKCLVTKEYMVSSIPAPAFGTLQQVLDTGNTAAFSGSSTLSFDLPGGSLAFDIFDGVNSPNPGTFLGLNYSNAEVSIYDNNNYSGLFLPSPTTSPEVKFNSATLDIEPSTIDNHIYRVPANTGTAATHYLATHVDGIAADSTGNVVTQATYTVATLPAGTVGDKAIVTDALAPAYLVITVGGGAVTCPVFYDGTNWVSN